MQFDEITQEALQLTLEQRAELAHRLLLSIDEPSEAEVERLWQEEAQRRLTEIREGTVQGIPAEEVMRRAIEDLSE